MDLGSGIQKKPISGSRGQKGPGSRGQKGTESQIRIRNTAKEKINKQYLTKISSEPGRHM
jgi:hypothetical protein